MELSDFLTAIAGSSESDSKPSALEAAIAAFDHRATAALLKDDPSLAIKKCAAAGVRPAAFAAGNGNVEVRV